MPRLALFPSANFDDETARVREREREREGASEKPVGPDRKFRTISDTTLAPMQDDGALVTAAGGPASPSSFCSDSHDSSANLQLRTGE
jgi:hypothetical protein